MSELIPVLRALAPTVVVTADATETLTGWCDRLFTLARGRLTEQPTHSSAARRGRSAADRRTADTLNRQGIDALDRQGANTPPAGRQHAGPARRQPAGPAGRGRGGPAGRRRARPRRGRGGAAGPGTSQGDALVRQGGDGAGRRRGGGRCRGSAARRERHRCLTSGGCSGWTPAAPRCWSRCPSSPRSGRRRRCPLCLSAAYWDNTVVALVNAVRFLGPVAAGLAAWAAVRERPLDYLRDLTARSPATGALLDLLLLSSAALVSYTAVTALVVAATLAQAEAGHPHPLGVIAGAGALVLHVVGYLMGRVVPHRATAALAFGATAMWAALRIPGVSWWSCCPRPRSPASTCSPPCAPGVRRPGALDGRADRRADPRLRAVGDAAVPARPAAGRRAGRDRHRHARPVRLRRRDGPRRTRAARVPAVAGDRLRAPRAARRAAPADGGPHPARGTAERHPRRVHGSTAASGLGAGLGGGRRRLHPPRREPLRRVRGTAVRQITGALKDPRACTDDSAGYRALVDAWLLGGDPVHHRRLRGPPVRGADRAAAPRVAAPPLHRVPHLHARPQDFRSAKKHSRRRTLDRATPPRERHPLRDRGCHPQRPRPRRSLRPVR